MINHFLAVFYNRIYDLAIFSKKTTEPPTSNHSNVKRRELIHATPGLHSLSQSHSPSFNNRPHSLGFTIGQRWRRCVLNGLSNGGDSLVDYLNTSQLFWCSSLIAAACMAKECYTGFRKLASPPTLPIVRSALLRHPCFVFVIIHPGTKVPSPNWSLIQNAVRRIVWRGFIWLV